MVTLVVALRTYLLTTPNLIGLHVGRIDHQQPKVHTQTPAYVCCCKNVEYMHRQL